MYNLYHLVNTVSLLLYYYKNINMYIYHKEDTKWIILNFFTPAVIQLFMLRNVPLVLVLMSGAHFMVRVGYNLPNQSLTVQCLVCFVFISNKAKSSL